MTDGRKKLRREIAVAIAAANCLGLQGCKTSEVEKPTPSPYYLQDDVSYVPVDPPWLKVAEDGTVVATPSGTSTSSSIQSNSDDGPKTRVDH